MLDDMAHRDDIERVRGQRRAFEGALDEVKAERAGECRSFRIGLQPLHRPSEVSHDSEEVSVPATDIEEATARRTWHGMDDLFALVPDRWDASHRAAGEPFRRIPRDTRIAEGFEHAPPTPGPEPVPLERRCACHAVRVIRLVQTPDLFRDGARIQPKVAARVTLPERPRAGRAPGPIPELPVSDATGGPAQWTCHRLHHVDAAIVQHGRIHDLGLRRAVDPITAIDAVQDSVGWKTGMGREDIIGKSRTPSPSNRQRAYPRRHGGELPGHHPELERTRLHPAVSPV